MSLFSQVGSGNFHPLFRFIEDYDNHRVGGSPISSSLRTFQPKFDVRETKDAYELQGELPGIEQKDISIEFSDAQTLVIKGHTTKDTSHGNVEEPQNHRITDADHQNSHQYYKATAEDEDPSAEGNSKAHSQVVPQSKEVKKAEAKKAEVKYKYWVSERSLGEFHRSFSFPGQVDQDAVKASLKNGILSVTVSKAQAKQGRRIHIE